MTMSATGSALHKNWEDTFRFFYDDSTGCVAHVKGVNPKQPSSVSLALNPAGVWACGGPCVTTQPPNAAGYGIDTSILRPEDYAVLLGLDRYEPILAFLAQHGCDRGFVARALEAAQVAPELRQDVLGRLVAAPPRRIASGETHAS